jgi:hypothetical protein
MAELQITYEELRRHIARFVGVGRDEGDFSGDAARLADVDDIMLSGLRSFYWPVIDAKEGVCHRWSFLDVDKTLDLVANQHTYLLPGNYSRLKESFTYPIGSEKRPIATVPYRHLRVLRSTENATGDPIYCAVQTRENADNGRTIYEVAFYPTPTTATTLSYTIEIEPQVANSNFDDAYPLGGAMHSETIIESCLAAAERVLNPEAGPGYHAEAFQRMLMASIEIDKSLVDVAAEADTWPLDGITGGVSSLVVTKSQLERLIGRAMTFSPNPKSWTHGQAVVVAEVLRNGLRKFYQPQVLPGERDTWQWSFLSPVHLMDIQSGVFEYDLPLDFSMVRGGITYSDGTGIMYPPIRLVSEEQVRQQLQATGNTARPFVAAVRVKNSNENTGTRYELLLAPIPSEDRQIAIPYAINPEQLGTDEALPMGGQPHAQTIIEACLAASEIHLGSGNSHQQEFLTCLQASISHDRMLSSPHSLGYNRDNSDNYNHDLPYVERFNRGDSMTTYNGAVYWD